MTHFGLEVGLAVLMLLVLGSNLVGGERGRRHAGAIAAIGLAILVGTAFALHPAGAVAGGAFVSDPLARFAKRLFLVSTLIGVVASLSLPGEAFRRRAAEYYLLWLASLLGMMMLASARDLILLFVAFELMSIPLYLLAGFLKREPEAVEASLKFFLVGTVSSAVMAYGLSFVYGTAQTTALPGVARALATEPPLLVLGLLAVLAGFGFKIAAVPFHMWVPDVYEAANTPFVAWLSVAPKAAGFVALFRIYLEGVGHRVTLWAPVIAALAALTVLGGNLMALPQQNAKRLLAYSGIAHIGYMLVGLAAVSASGSAMVLFYLVTYVFANMGAFLVVEVVARAELTEHLSGFRGLAQRSPLLALAMLLFLLSLGGIPFVAGFWAKLYVLWAAAEAGLYWLVLLAAILTVVALFYYLRIARRMYMDPPPRPEPLRVPPVMALCVIVCTLAILVFGIYPSPLVLAALRATSRLF